MLDRLPHVEVGGDGTGEDYPNGSGVVLSELDIPDHLYERH